MGPSNSGPYMPLVAALALSGQEAEAHEKLQEYLALSPNAPIRTIAAWKAYNERFTGARTDPRVLESHERGYDALRKAGMPEQ